MDEELHWSQATSLNNCTVAEEYNCAAAAQGYKFEPARTCVLTVNRSANSPTMREDLLAGMIKEEDSNIIANCYIYIYTIHI